VIAAAFMDAKLMAQKVVWIGMFEKAKAFVDEALEGGQITFDTLLQEATKLI
jgi:hypothetical protein